MGNGKHQKRFLCGTCCTRTRSLNAVRAHIMQKHSKHRSVQIFEVRETWEMPAHEKDDQSIASRSIEASIDRAMGLDLDEEDQTLADMAEGRL